MLSANNSLRFTNQCNFKHNERKFGVKIAGKLVDTDSYILNIDRDIFMKAIEDSNIKISNTYNFAIGQLKLTKQKTEEELYKKLIQRCFDDIDEAVINKAPKEKINKLTETLELFIKKYGHLEG